MVFAGSLFFQVLFVDEPVVLHHGHVVLLTLAMVTLIRAMAGAVAGCSFDGLQAEANRGQAGASARLVRPAKDFVRREAMAKSMQNLGPSSTG